MLQDQSQGPTVTDKKMLWSTGLDAPLQQRIVVTGSQVGNGNCSHCRRIWAMASSQSMPGI